MKLETRIFLIVFVFFCSVKIVFASDISQFVFTTNSQTIKPNAISEKLTIQAQDAGGNSVNIPQTGCLKLETTSATGEFSASSTGWVSVDKLTMNKGWANRNFYYRDSTAGNYALTVKAALISCSSWTEGQWTARQDIIVSDNGVSPPPVQDASTSLGASSVSSSDWPTEPQIYANAGSDKTAVAGADVYFSGQALGLQKEPLENARYLWNFGDGAIAEGQNAKHVYKYPGEYIVVLDVSSGKYSVSDRSMVKIIPNQLEIIEANQNYIKLHNGSNVELDISSWFLRAENSLFKFPANTFIKINKDLMIDSSISGLKAENQKAELLYPNGSVANSYFGYAKAEKEKEPKSTTVVDSKKIEEIEELSTSTAQVANIISTTESNSFGFKKWLMIILGMSVFFAGGFIFIRRQSSL